MQQVQRVTTSVTILRQETVDDLTWYKSLQIFFKKTYVLNESTKKQKQLKVMSYIREKEYTWYLNEQVYNLYIYRFLPEVQALYTFSPPHPPTQMISFQQRSSMQKTPFLIWSILKKNIIQGQNRDLQSLFVYNPTVPTLVFYCYLVQKLPEQLYKTVVFLVCCIHSTITAYFSSFHRLRSQRMNLTISWRVHTSIKTCLPQNRKSSFFVIWSIMCMPNKILIVSLL